MIAGDGVGWWFCLLFGVWGGFCIVFRFGLPCRLVEYWLWCCLVLGFVLLWFSCKLILVLDLGVSCGFVVCMNLCLRWFGFVCWV